MRHRDKVDAVMQSLVLLLQTKHTSWACMDALISELQEKKISRMGAVNFDVIYQKHYFVPNQTNP